jgi:hypothetical protein
MRATGMIEREQGVELYFQETAVSLRSAVQCIWYVTHYFKRLMNGESFNLHKVGTNMISTLQMELYSIENLATCTRLHVS